MIVSSASSMAAPRARGAWGNSWTMRYTTAWASPVNGALADDALVEERAQRVDVGASVDVAAGDLLRAEVAERAHQRARPRHAALAGARARPKSITRTRTPSPSSRATMMFSGLMSRCTTPRAWL